MMKKLYYFPVILFILFLSGLAAKAQDSTVFPPDYVVDTRIDNMGYWRRCAAAGLVPVQPYTRIPAAVYSGSKVFDKGVLVDDSPDVPVTTENSTQSENSTVINPNSNAHVLNSNNSSANPVGSFYGANYFHSFDEAETWTGQLQGAGGSNNGDPAACINLTGRYFIGYIDMAYGQSVSYSDDNGTTWTVKKVSNGTMFNMLDKNHLWVDNSPTSPFEGYLYDGWMESNNIYICRSMTNGTSWESKVNISAGTNAGSHNQGVNFKTGPNGEVYAAWSVYDSWPSDEKAIGFAKSLDGGATWTPGARILNNIKGIRTSGVDQNMRVNSFPTMTVDLSNSPYRGHIYIVWPNIGYPGTNQGPGSDVYMIKSTDNGATWSAPMQINTDPTGQGKEHYFPWITCDKANGMLSIVFYDNRNVAANKTETWLAYSSDGGATWSDMKVSDVSMTPSPIPGLASGYMGDYLGIDAYAGKAYPTWGDNRSGHMMTYVSPIDLIAPAANLVHDDHTINDIPSGNGDGLMSYGDTILLSVDVKNIGNLDADSVWVTIRCESPYITMIDSIEFYGDIVQGDSVAIPDGFQFAVANTIPNAQDITFMCDATDATDSTTTSSFVIQSFAPAPTILLLQVIDAGGNNNGRLDPGETATLNILTKNTGLYPALDVVSTLVSENPFVTVENQTFPIGTLAPGQEVNAVFQVTVDASAYIGSAVVFHNVAQAQYQADEENFLLMIGLIVEDWETGNFNKFDWQFAGDGNWMIDPTTKYEGDYSSKSATIADGQTAQLVIQYNVMYDDSISFFRKVSSQPLSDKLKFFIDDLMVGMWSGNQEWKYSAYPVLAGPHTFKWIYEKDATGSLNLDAAWVDYIVFPPEYKLAVNAGANATACGLSPYQPEAMAINFDSLLWTTSGTGTFDDPAILRPFYTPSAQDLAGGSVTLTLTAWSMGIDSTDQVILTIAPEVSANAGTDATVCSNGSYSLDEASAANYGTLSWTTSGDGSFNDPVILNPVYTPGEADVAAGTVTLALTAIPSVECPSVTDQITLSVFTAPVVNLGQDTSICANLLYFLDATTPGAVAYLWTPGGAATPTIMADSAGTGIGNKLISVVVTDQNGCEGTDAVTINFKDCTALNELSGIGINIYPNPGSGLFMLDLKTNTVEKISLRIFTSSGEILFEEQNLIINRSLTHKIDLSSRGNGTYFLELSKGNDRLVRKLVVSK